MPRLLALLLLLIPSLAFAQANTSQTNQLITKITDYIVFSGTTPPLAANGACRLYADGTNLYMSCNGGAYTAFATGGAAAPSNAQYWVGAADGTLSAEKNLGALATGLVINTAGVPSAYTGVSSCSAGSAITALSASGAGTCTAISGTVIFAPPGLRLTATTAVPVTVTDVTAAGTLFYTPYVSGSLVYYTGSAWAQATIAEISLALTVSSGSNYDVFVACSSSTVCALSLSSAWASDTARTDALGTQNGVTVLNSDKTKLLIGTIRGSGANTIEDSAAKRYLANVFNRTRRAMAGATETANTWTTNSSTWIQANANAANQLDYVVSIATDGIEAFVAAPASVAGTHGAGVGVGVDSTTVNSAQIRGAHAGTTSNTYQLSASWRGGTAAGRHTLPWLVITDGTTTTFWGDAGTTYIQGGITGSVEN